MGRGGWWMGSEQNNHSMWGWISLRIQCICAAMANILRERKSLTRTQKSSLPKISRRKSEKKMKNIKYWTYEYRISLLSRKAIIIFPSIFLRSLYIPFLIVDRNLRAENSKIFTSRTALLSLLFFDNSENSMMIISSNNLTFNLRGWWNKKNSNKTSPTKKSLTYNPVNLSK